MILAWLKRLLSLFTRPDPRGRKIPWPTKEAIAQLPPFEGLELPDIIEIVSPEGAHRASKEIMAAGLVGFDTESKPTFIKGQRSNGPHVVQFSTADRAYVFMLHDREIRRVVAQLIRSDELKKVGFGLDEDLRLIPIKLSVKPAAVLDLETLFASRGYGRGVGAKVGVAIALKRRLIKSKKISTSNWANRRLTDRQLLYAANDACAAIRVFHALNHS